eukprot:TRINITY_DN4299_c0_g1_i1.p1 TRINITY_DN4299_c0_g1~~TRINITY_DN4299_c0_g1_i1.p1  ORF type:complete len:229 (+),score=61.69 TRINITY_DN4299_c0_g1_i1:89-775(+)
MVTFVCDCCQKTCTKPKVKNHLYTCPDAIFVCIDCNTRFDRVTVNQHTSCISEADKYHGKFAKKKSNNNINNNNKTNNNTKTPNNTNTNTPNNTPNNINNTPNSTSISNETHLKRKRESDSFQKEETKKIKVNETITAPTPVVSSSTSSFGVDSSYVVDLQKLKWKRKTKKYLKKCASTTGTIPLDQLKTKVVDDLMADIRKKAEEVFDYQVQLNKKLTIVENQVSRK